MFERRVFLKTGLAGLASLLPGAVASQTPVPAPSPAGEPLKAVPEPSAFDPASVIEAARALSKKPYKAPAAELPEAFSALNFEQYAAIRNQAGAAIWASESLGYAIEPLHRGFVFTSPVSLHVVENGAPRRLAYNPADFAFGQLKAPTDGRDLGFSGFRVLRLREGKPPVEVAIFQGASFFRSLASGQA